MVDLLSPVSPDAFQTMPVREEMAFDDGPGKWRIGLIVLSNDYTVERDFMNMRPNDDVAIFTTRIANSADCTVKSLKAMAPGISDATRLLVPDGSLGTVAYACTSGSVVIGYDTVCDRINAVRPDAICITPITASHTALECFSAKKIAVLTPYVDEVNAMIDMHLKNSGMDIVAFSSFQIEDNEEMAALTSEAIFRAAMKADHPEAEALFISCTAIRAVDVVEQIEQSLGKPVITANQAMFWQALRASGCEAKVQGYGTLLREY